MSSTGELPSNFNGFLPQNPKHRAIELALRRADHNRCAELALAAAFQQAAAAQTLQEQIAQNGGLTA